MLCKNCGKVEAPSGADYCEKCEDLWLSAGMTRDEQEALSRAHSDDVIRILKLKSGKLAVFNNARELCGIVDLEEDVEDADDFERILRVFFPPKKAPAVDLEELGLL